MRIHRFFLSFRACRRFVRRSSPVRDRCAASGFSLSSSSRLHFSLTSVVARRAIRSVICVHSFPGAAALSSDSALHNAPSFHLTLAHLVIGGAFVFIASNLLFAMSLRLWPGAVLGAGCLGAAIIILREANKNSFLATPVHMPFFALCMATGFGLCLLGGQGHLLYAAEDWLIRDAVVADLSASALPAYAWNGATWVLRAPLGMYLLPGALGRLAGLGAAHGLMFVQNACLIGCSLYLIAEAFQQRTLGFLAIFVLFSGLDFFGQSGVCRRCFLRRTSGQNLTLGALF